MSKNSERIDITQVLWDLALWGTGSSIALIIIYLLFK